MTNAARLVSISYFLVNVVKSLSRGLMKQNAIFSYILAFLPVVNFERIKPAWLFTFSKMKHFSWGSVSFLRTLQSNP